MRVSDELYAYILQGTTRGPQVFDRAEDSLSPPPTLRTRTPPPPSTLGSKDSDFFLRGPPGLRTQGRNRRGPCFKGTSNRNIEVVRSPSPRPGYTRPFSRRT